MANFLNSNSKQAYALPPNRDTLIGEFSFSLPTQKEFPQVPGPYFFNNGDKRDVAKCVMRIGLIRDTPFSVPAPEVAPFTNYLNIYIKTGTFFTWRKYWCILLRNVLAVYDFEYKMVAFHP